LKTIVVELSGSTTTESPPPQFRPVTGRTKPAEEEDVTDLDAGEAADIFASILSGKSVKVKKKTTTVAPKETTTKVGFC
jgi:hypothetical protein